MKKLIFISVMLCLATFAGTSFATVIPDTYLHPLDGDSGQVNSDIIGSSVPFQVSGHEWTSTTQLKIYSAWNSPTLGGNPIGYGGTTSLKVGDVFLTYTGPTGQSPLDFHNESWNLAVALRNHDLEGDGITAGTIFFPTGPRLADAYFSWADTIYYGDGELVTASGIDSGKDVTILYVAGSYILIDFSNTGYTFNPQTGIRYTETCGNDVIVSNAAAVPEPATIFLLGSGLLSLAGLARKKFRKQ